jgi:hypothetical protein
VARVPIRDPYGRWLSDDGLYAWDGQRWQPAYGPYGPAPLRPRRSAWPWVLGASAVVVLLLLLFGACTYAMTTSPEFKQGYYNGYCSSYDKSHPDQACPLTPP